MMQNPSKSGVVKAGALLFVFAVASLSTLAKESQYVPKLNPLHYFSKSIKLQVVDHSHSLHVVPVSLPVARVVPPQSSFSYQPLPNLHRLTLCLNGLAVAFLHRGPPSLIA